MGGRVRVHGHFFNVAGTLRVPSAESEEDTRRRHTECLPLSGPERMGGRHGFVTIVLRPLLNWLTQSPVQKPNVPRGFCRRPAPKNPSPPPGHGGERPVGTLE